MVVRASNPSTKTTKKRNDCLSFGFPTSAVGPTALLRPLLGPLPRV